MLQLNLAVDLDSATAFLSSVSRRHIPFAAARALSAVAVEARDAVRTDIPHRFTIRRPWIIRGIGMERATKSSLEACGRVRAVVIKSNTGEFGAIERYMVPLWECRKRGSAARHFFTVSL